MIRYAFWNNKGGTGKSSLAFQAVSTFSKNNKDAKILVLDLCPQANMSELLLGSLIGEGSKNLLRLQQSDSRKTVGGYFQIRLPSPFSVPSFDSDSFICTPSDYNRYIPRNIDLVAGDSLVELQSNSMSTLANTQIPGTNTWLSVINWINDLISATGDKYDYLFIDTNPSFSIYTQIALAASEKMILPVMADDSSRRAVQNALALVHGIDLPVEYAEFNFSTQLKNGDQEPPKFHLFAKNRLTQYMGPASAYHSVLTSIDTIVSNHLDSHPEIFSFKELAKGTTEVRDFQTTGVVSFAHGNPFVNMSTGSYPMPGRDKPTQINADNLRNCIDAVNDLVELI